MFKLRKNLQKTVDNFLFDTFSLYVTCKPKKKSNCILLH